MPRRLSTELGLQDEPQDWGIVNADAVRLDEFIEVYERPDLVDAERFELVELVLASANEALERDAAADLHRLSQLLPGMRRQAAVTVEYWVRLDADEFPIARWLRSTA